VRSDSGRMPDTFLSGRSTKVLRLFCFAACSGCGAGLGARAGDVPEKTTPGSCSPRISGCRFPDLSYDGGQTVVPRGFPVRARPCVLRSTKNSHSQQSAFCWDWRGFFAVFFSLRWLLLRWPRCLFRSGLRCILWGVWSPPVVFWSCFRNQVTRVRRFASCTWRRVSRLSRASCW
jgi:hypothetical protein